jgi:Zn-dependent protease
MNLDLLELIKKLADFFVPFLFSLCFHEFAHGFVAKLLGDRTAERMGRLTLNPMAHADPIGTFLLPLLSIVLNSPISFGWAKPVPVDVRNLKNPRTDMFWVALAGPLSNILLAVIGTILIGVLKYTYEVFPLAKTLIQILVNFIGINLFLAIFNLLPIHPLDGGKVIARFLPASWNHKLEQNEGIMSIALLLLILSGAIQILVIPVRFIFGILLGMAGI